MPDIRIPKVEIVPIGWIKRDLSNPNRMSKEQFEALKRNLSRYGFIVPIITNMDYLLADGDHRDQAAAALGMTEIPVIRLELNDVERRILRQALNKLHGEHIPSLDAEEFRKILEAGKLVDLAGLIARPEEELRKFISDAEKDFQPLPDLDPFMGGAKLIKCPKCVRSLKTLIIKPCTPTAARYAVEKWHYSHTFPASIANFGVWEDDIFVGAVVFGVGAGPRAHKPFGLKKHEVCELVRVALHTHENPVTRIVSIALRLLKKARPCIRLVVSYADERQGHTGKIYRAGNWLYLGKIVSELRYFLNGMTLHNRTVYERYGTRNLDLLRENVDSAAHLVNDPPKHKFIYCFDKELQVKFVSRIVKTAPLAQVEVCRPYQGGGSGAIPTTAHTRGG